jgi:formyltetrahydrofolate-dependent phosphoribosylglycinamide formyltransferase
MANKKNRLVVLASGFGSNLQAIIDACAAGDLDAEVVGVVCDRKKAYSFERAEKAGIPSRYHPWKPYKDAGKDRREFDADLAEIVAEFEPTLVILAGWMRVLTSAFLNQYPMRVINLHPALPGTFAGTHAIERAWNSYQSGEITQTGVMVHYVPDEGVDDGPVIAQEVVTISDDDTLESLEERIHKVEHRLLVQAIQQAFDTIRYP